MKIKLFVFFLILTTEAFPQVRNDSIALVKLLIDDYKTMGTWDIKRHVENTTDKYLLIENGEIWNMGKETEYYHANAHRVIDRKDYFDIKYVRIYGKTAYAVYNLKSDITENGHLKTKNWAESVVFRKWRGKWKVELIHSTPLAIKTN